MLRELLYLSRLYLNAEPSEERAVFYALRSCLDRWAGDDEELIREANQFMLRMGTRRMNPSLWSTVRKVRFNRK